jgi:hypothetical protein
MAHGDGGRSTTAVPGPTSSAAALGSSSPAMTRSLPACPSSRDDVELPAQEEQGPEASGAPGGGGKWRGSCSSCGPAAQARLCTSPASSGEVHPNHCSIWRQRRGGLGGALLPFRVGARRRWWSGCVRRSRCEGCANNDEGGPRVRRIRRKQEVSFFLPSASSTPLQHSFLHLFPPGTF